MIYKRLCAFLLVCFLACSGAGCKEQAAENNGPEGFSMTPVSASEPSGGTLSIGAFQYTLPEEGDSLALFVEQWNGQTLVNRQRLSVPSEKGRSGEVTLRLTLEGAEFRSARWAGQSSSGESSVALPLPWDLGVVYAFWSPEDALWYQTWQGADPEDGIVLACLGTGDLEQGLPSLSCSSWMADSSQFTAFSEIQLIRAVVTEPGTAPNQEGGPP